jgi:hypothetical protein
MERKEREWEGRRRGREERKGKKGEEEGEQERGIKLYSS